MDDDRTGQRIVLGVVLGLGCIAGGGYLIYDGYLTVVNAEETDAVVRDSHVSGIAGDDEYRVHVTYEYTYEGETYTSDDIYPNRDADRYSSRRDARRFVERYPEGETATAYVDPEDPSEAYLEDGIRFKSLVGYLVLVLIGLVTLAGGLQQIRSR